MTQPTTKNDETIDLEEVYDEASTPLTSINADAVPVHLSRSISVERINQRDNTQPNLESTVNNNRSERQPHIGFTNSFSEFPDPASMQVTPDVNIYQHKKTLAQGMMDLALLSANANQLRYVLQTDGRHPYFYPSLSLIGMSLLLQIVVGIGLIWNSRYNVKKHEEMCKANKANNWTVIGIFLVTIFNVFISSFGVVDQVATTATVAK